MRLVQLTTNQGNLLILDKPTNYIDQETKESLQDGIRKFPGTVIIVSHKQEFYQDLVQRATKIGPR